MIVVAWPILSGDNTDAHTAVSQRTQDYTTSKNLLVSVADALERIMTSFKEVRICLFPRGGREEGWRERKRRGRREERKRREGERGREGEGGRREGKRGREGKEGRRERKRREGGREGERGGRIIHSLRGESIMCFFSFCFFQITELSGYTSRVTEVIHVFEEVQKGKFEVTSVSTAEPPPESKWEWLMVNKPHLVKDQIEVLLL